MKTNKRESYIMTGIALLVIAGIFIAIGLSQPRIYSGSAQSGVTATEAVTKETNSSKASKNNTAQTTLPDYPLNINTATFEELMTIEHLGEKKASAIIEYRNHLGKYTSVEQIMEIEGFGEETYKAVAGYLTV